MQKKLKIMDDIMCAVTQTEEWDRIQTSDPAILEANKETRELLELIRPAISDDLLYRLDDAISGQFCAYVDAAILYGIQVADAIHAVSENPEALSYHVMERIGRLETAR